MKYMSDDGIVFNSEQECSNHENKNKFLKRKKNGEKINEYIYIFERGKEEIIKHEIGIKEIHDDGFDLESNYGYTLSYEDIGEWRQTSWSAGCSYRYIILLTCDESIEKYLSEIKHHIATCIQNQIESLTGYLKNLA